METNEEFKLLIGVVTKNVEKLDVYSPKHLFTKKAIGIFLNYLELFNSSNLYPVNPVKFLKLLSIYFFTGLFSGRIIKQLHNMEFSIKEATLMIIIMEQAKENTEYLKNKAQLDKDLQTNK